MDNAVASVDVGVKHFGRSRRRVKCHSSQQHLEGFRIKICDRQGGM